MNDYFVIAVLVVSIPVLFWISRKQKDKETEEKRRNELKKEYPELISKVLLLMRAGLVSRSVFFRIAADYKKDLRNGKKKKVVYDEVLKACTEMEKGIGEVECYHRFGQRCVLPSYKTLSVLLIQNVKNGGNGIIDMLEREMENANDERKRFARIAGEKASVKLLLPMGLMLLVVLAVMIVPAFMSI